MSRMERLLELSIKLQYRARFTAQELADEMGVSRRTMLRDLQTLQLMGVPLSATPGPHGGYEVDPHRRLLSLAFSVEEASGMVLSYEAFLRYAQSPFAASSLSALTKLRNALPPDTVHTLDRIKQHVAVLDDRPQYEAPHIEALLHAALERVHLRIRYDGRNGTSERVIFPFGLYAQRGFWYIACYDHRRGANITLRADRVRSLDVVDGLEPRPHIAVTRWLETVQYHYEGGLPLRARVSPRGVKNADLETLFGPLPTDAEGYGLLDATIPASEMEYFAARLLPLGTDIVVQSPPELVAALREKAAAVAALYGAAT